MTLRLATTDDAPALLRLINAAYRVEAFFVRGDRITEGEVRARLRIPDGAFLVVDTPDPGRLSGAVYVEVRGVRGHFALLSVDPDYQRQGIGRTLVAAAEAHCRAAGCRALDLDVVDLRRELPAFYAGLGFTRTGTAPFPTPDRLTRPAHLELMTKPLV